MFIRPSAEDEGSLLRRAAAHAGFPTLEDLTPEVLQKMTRAAGIDFATALLFDRMRRSKAHASFIERIDALRQAPAPRKTTGRFQVVIVPGALYVERPDMGGDGRVIREVAEAAGLPTDFVPLASCGSVTGNAERIREWLRRRGDDRRIVLVSLSKGGADLKLALAAPDAGEVFRSVAAWINVCGPLQGSGMANWVLDSRIRTWLARAKFRWQRRDFQFVTDLRRGRGTPLDGAPRLPLSLWLVTLIGFPLRRHLTTRFSRFCHRTLAEHGPNDGTTSLADVAAWPGTIYPAWGMDHYFRPENAARSLVSAVLESVEDDTITQGSLGNSATPG